MEGDQLLQRYQSPDGNRLVELRERPDGKFYFQEFYEATDNIPEYGPVTYTSPGWQSGLYERALRPQKATSKRWLDGWLE